MGDATTHPFWRGDSALGFDFALVKLNITSEQQPIQLMPKDMELEDQQDLTAIGFGRLQDNGAFAVSLQVAEELPFIPPEDCSGILGLNAQEIVCAGDGTANICAGASFTAASQKVALTLHGHHLNFFNRPQPIIVRMAVSVYGGCICASCAQYQPPVLLLDSIP